MAQNVFSRSRGGELGSKLYFTQRKTGRADGKQKTHILAVCSSPPMQANTLKPRKLLLPRKSLKKVRAQKCIEAHYKPSSSGCVMPPTSCNYYMHFTSTLHRFHLQNHSSLFTQRAASSSSPDTADPPYPNNQHGRLGIYMNFSMALMREALGTAPMMVSIFLPSLKIMTCRRSQACMRF